jgi:hypothetical protein
MNVAWVVVVDVISLYPKVKIAQCGTLRHAHDTPLQSHCVHHIHPAVLRIGAAGYTWGSIGMDSGFRG